MFENEHVIGKWPFLFENIYKRKTVLENGNNLRLCVIVTSSNEKSRAFIALFEKYFVSQS